MSPRSELSPGSPLREPRAEVNNWVQAPNFSTGKLEDGKRYQSYVPEFIHGVLTPNS